MSLPTAQFLPTGTSSDSSTWTDPDNVLLDDELFAVATLSRAIHYPTGFTDHATGSLVVDTFTGITSGMAAGDTVDGYEIEVRAKCSNAALGVELAIRVEPDGDAESQALTEEWAVYTFGGPTSTFGQAQSSRTALDLAQNVVLADAIGTISYGESTVSIEYIKLKVYWSETACDDFNFTPQTGVALSTWIYSNVVSISGMPSDFTGSFGFTGADIDGIADAEVCKNNDGKWSANTSGTVVNGDTFQIRRFNKYARATDDFATSYPLTVQSMVKYFTMTTIAPDVTPTQTFAPRATTGLPRSSLVKAPFTFRIDGVNTISFGGGFAAIEGETTANVATQSFQCSTAVVEQQVTDIAYPFTPQQGVRGPYDETYTFVALYNGDDLEYWVNTPAGYGAANTIDGWVLGSQTPTWTFTTVANVLTPTQAYWATPAAVSTSTVTTSVTTIVMAGIDGTAAVTFSTSGGSAHEFSKNSGAWTAVAGGTTVVNGDSIQVRMTSPGAGSQSGNIVMKVNGGTGMHAAFTIVTTGGDVTPSAFSFTDVTGSVAGLLNTSNAQVLAGVTAAQPILATVSPGFQIRVGAGAWTDGSLSVLNGDSLTIRGYAPLQAGATATCVVTIGGTQDTWTITSRAVNAFWD